MKRYYEVVVFDPNSWHPDGSPVCLRTCGHKHRTIRTAYKCLRYLQSDNAAKWYHATIQTNDGHVITRGERGALENIEGEL